MREVSKEHKQRGQNRCSDNSRSGQCALHIASADGFRLKKENAFSSGNVIFKPLLLATGGLCVSVGWVSFSPHEIKNIKNEIIYIQFLIIMPINLLNLLCVIIECSFVYSLVGLHNIVVVFRANCFELPKSRGWLCRL